MRIGLRLGRPAAVVCALFAASALSAAIVLEWTRSEALDKSFSIETPCSSDEIARGQAAPEQLAGLKTSRASRVLCMRDQMVFVAIRQSPATASGSPTLFDMVLERAGKDGNEPGLKMGKLDDRRALFNREASDGDTAQTALVDLGKDGLLILNVGILAGSPLSEEERGQVIDRFTNSLKVNAK